MDLQRRAVDIVDQYNQLVVQLNNNTATINQLQTQNTDITAQIHKLQGAHELVTSLMAEENATPVDAAATPQLQLVAPGSSFAEEDVPTTS